MEADTPFMLREKLALAPGLVSVWKLSSARHGARLALAMVMSHHPEADIRGITKGLAEHDDNGEKLNHTAIWESVAGYACRVAKMTDLVTPFMEEIPIPPRPEGEPSSDEGEEGSASE